MLSYFVFAFMISSFYGLVDKESKKEHGEAGSHLGPLRDFS